MDLRELNDNVERHPWEIVRLKAIKNIITRYIDKRVIHKVLDVGCGDAFITNNLCKNVNIQLIDGVDINLSAEQLNLFTKGENVHLYNSYDKLKDYDLILMCDILEHVEDYSTFLTDIIAHYLLPGGYILITVPAFQFLFSSHDVFLGHFRRYNLKQLDKLGDQQGIYRVSSGYLFFSLFTFRFLGLLLNSAFPSNIHKNPGIGRWKGGKFVSCCIEYFLMLDAYILLLLSYFKIKLPGLSAWILCRKQSL